MNKTVLLSAMLAIGSHSFADSYQYSLDGQYSDTDFDQSGDIEAYQISANYYLQPVDTSKGPLFEADFLSRSSRISAFYSDGEQDNSFVSDTDFEAKGVSGLYISPEKGWFVGAGYAQDERETFLNDIDTDTYFVTVGSYIAKNTTFSVSFEHSDDDSPSSTVTVPNFGGIGGFASINTPTPALVNSGLFFNPFNTLLPTSTITVTNKSETEVKTTTLALRHFGNCGDFPFSFSANYQNGDSKTKFSSTINSQPSVNIRTETDQERYGANIALYPNNNWRISAGYQKTDVENTHSREYSLGVNWFITDNISLDVVYRDVKADDNVIVAAAGGFVSRGSIDPLALGFDPTIPSQIYSFTSPLLNLDNDRDVVSVGVNIRF